MDFKYNIREMEKQDLEQITSLEESCFSMPWKYHDFEEILSNPNRVYLVAELQNEPQIIGGCMLTEIAGEGDISNVAVYSEYRGNHIATELLKELIMYAEKRWNTNAFTLEVRSKNAAAIKLYENAGFKSVGIRPRFYDKPKDDAVIMWLNKD